MVNINLSDYKTLYLSTARDYILQMKSSLQTLENASGDTAAKEILHRSAHSLKSQSLVMGYKTTGELSHQIEVYGRLIKDGTKDVLSHHLKAITKSVEMLDNSLQTIDISGIEIDLTEATEELVEITA